MYPTPIQIRPEVRFQFKELIRKKFYVRNKNLLEPPVFKSRLLICATGFEMSSERNEPYLTRSSHIPHL